MRAFVILEPNVAELQEITRPVIKEDELLIKVSAAGFCGTDVHTFKGEHPSQYPLVPGHEFSGIVYDIGKRTSQFEVGDKVVVDPNVFCESCWQCKQNKQIHCERIQVVGNTRNGAFAEFVNVPEKCAFLIPDNSDMAVMSLAEPLACVINAHNRIPIPIGGDVLIFGAGTIGLMHLLVSKRRGAATVTMVDIKQRQLDLARELGADHVFLSDAALTENIRKVFPRGFITIIEATGVPKVAEAGLPLLQNTGTFVQFGACAIGSSIKIDPQDIYFRDLHIVGTYALQKTMQQSINLISNGDMNLSPLIGRRISLQEVPSAFNDFVQGKLNGKTVICFD